MVTHRRIGWGILAFCFVVVLAGMFCAVGLTLLASLAFAVGILAFACLATLGVVLVTGGVWT